MKMHIKKGDDSQFLYETTTDTLIDDLLKEVLAIYNGRLKVERIGPEINELADHGITLPPNMHGLAEEQIADLKLRDDWADKCTPQGGAEYKKDDIGRRNGQAPNDHMSSVLKKTVAESKTLISKDNIKNNVCVTIKTVQEALDILRGAVTIVYPMGLPPHDPIRMEFENNEDLSGQQASLDVMDVETSSVWFSGKEMTRGKKLCDFAGKNEKTKIIVKLQKKGQGPPSREPVVNEEEQKNMMAYYYRKQEDMKKLEAESDDSYMDSAWAIGAPHGPIQMLLNKLEAESDDSYMDSAWADTNALKRNFHGLRDIKWGPR